ncbi:hypothetical protein [Sporosarcina sp. Te-1]|uniref:hypothetical protein n=1 Tax=Sporosarcina sp. Te-1 TaxID=2818390 RepID=UPI001A9E8C37|nr:hypothetical protein [Sporosarcina sp. Te-1]QTD41253.1 hypothetical protein J3U78_21465 [Sporosarcina sp. Te-1]
MKNITQNPYNFRFKFVLFPVLLLGIAFLTGCNQMQKAKTEEVIQYEKNYEIIGLEKEEMLGEVNPAIVATVDRSTANLQPVHGSIYYHKGEKIHVPSGRYQITGTPAGNIIIYDENDELILRELVGYVAGVYSLTLDIDETHGIYIDGGYTDYTIMPVETEKSVDLSAGLWKVGLDIEPGTYTITTEVDFGYLHIIEENKEPIVYEVISGEHVGGTVQLKEGQTIRITKTSMVHFEKK